MSRGPGLWQRQILEGVDAGNAVILTSPDHSHAEQNAIRRAARTLEARGLIKITADRINGTPRLVACPPTMAVPETQIITGLDGKKYMRPMH